MVLLLALSTALLFVSIKGGDDDDDDDDAGDVKKVKGWPDAAAAASSSSPSRSLPRQQHPNMLARPALTMQGAGHLI